ncbi:MAG: FTR1 family protein, partial [Gemmatimonadales bacterium]
MRLILIGVVGLILPASLLASAPSSVERTVRAAPATRSAADAPPAFADSAQALRRLATTARLAAEEYRLGVKNGQVVLEPEVEEARLFLGEAAKAAGALPAGFATSSVRDLNAIIALVNRLAEPDSVRSAVERLVGTLAAGLAVSLDETPEVSPSLALGETIYRDQCASCHGLTGDGKGPAAVGMAPAPSTLADQAFFHQATPLDFYRRITIGVAGTSMAAYETTLSSEQRWAVALYASTLRLPVARGSARADLADFAVSALLSDQDLLDSLGTDDLSRVAAVRAASGGDPRRDYGAVFRVVRARIDSSYREAQAGRAEPARSMAIAAYMAFERVERELRIKDPDLVVRAERAFADLRESGDPVQLAATREELTRTLDRAERAIGSALTPVSLFLQSFLILVREGLEAILVIGALIAFLVKMGAGDRKRDIHLGVGAAIGLSVLTAVALETVFRLGPTHQEALEGFTMVIAAVMLFFVSYWLLSKMEVTKWNQFVKSRLSEALGKRSMMALASVAFLAVYREGFETVLFYKALAVSGGSAGTGGPIIAGFIVAAVVLAIVYVAINRFGLRLPLRPFFAVTSGFLYFMAVSFAGTAVAELQEGGFLPTTTIPGMFRAPTFGIYPTIQSLSAQAVLVLLAG